MDRRPDVAPSQPIARAGKPARQPAEADTTGITVLAHSRHRGQRWLDAARRHRCATCGRTRRSDGWRRSVFTSWAAVARDRPERGARATRPKAWALLAYLVLTRSVPSRERLAGLLFGDARDPLGALRWNLAELRRSLGPAVDLGGDPVVLGLPVDAFVDVLALGSATWVEAVRVPGLGGELLEGIEPQAAAAFETWLLAERRHAAGLSAAVLREAAIARLAGARQDRRSSWRRSSWRSTSSTRRPTPCCPCVRRDGCCAQAREHLDATVVRFRRELGIEPSATLMNAIDTAVLRPPRRHPRSQVPRRQSR